MTVLPYHEEFLLFCPSFKLAVCWLWGLSQVILRTALPTIHFSAIGVADLCFALLILNPHGHFWSFVHPSHRICLRWLMSSKPAERAGHPSPSDRWRGADTHWDPCYSAEGHSKEKAQSFVHPALGLGGSKSPTSTLIHQILCPATPFVSPLIYSETRTTCSLSFFLFAVSIKPTSTALPYAVTGLKAISTLCLITALHCTRTVLLAQFGN